MKRMLKKTLATALIIVMTLCVVACGGGDDDGYISYTSAGLNYEFPDYIQEIDVNYADYAYASMDYSIMTRDVEVLMYFYSSDQLISDLALSRNVTVKDYAKWFIRQYAGVTMEENYDEENSIITLKYVYEEGSDSYFFFDYIIRNEYMLYHITYSCDPENRALYEADFEEWASRISMIY